MSKKITDLLEGVKEQVIMRDYTTLKVGGVADYYYEARRVDDLIKAVKAAYRLKIPYFVLGNGSNILFSDFGFPGLVVKNLTSNISFMDENSQVIADSGVLLPKIIIESISRDLAGIEFLYGVPGTVGGAVYGNAGAYGASIGDYVKGITVLELDPETEKLKIVQHDMDWMDFSYRSSKLKTMKNKYKPVILTIRFQFSKNQKEELMRRLKKYKEHRLNSQPVGLSAGCVFKNPIPKEIANVTGRGTRGMPELPKERTAGFLLDQAGAKKLKLNNVEVSSKHANFIVNSGAKATEIRTLIEEMREAVREKYNIILHEEIEYVGQW